MLYDTTSQIWKRLTKFTTENFRSAFIADKLKLPGAPIHTLKVASTDESLFGIKQCHQNCQIAMAAVSELGLPQYYTALTCWIVYSAKEIIADAKSVGVNLKVRPDRNEFEAEFHCVLQSESGELIQYITYVLQTQRPT